MSVLFCVNTTLINISPVTATSWGMNAIGLWCSSVRWLSLMGSSLDAAGQGVNAKSVNALDVL